MKCNTYIFHIERQSFILVKFCSNMVINNHKFVVWHWDHISKKWFIILKNWKWNVIKKNCIQRIKPIIDIDSVWRKCDFAVKVKTTKCQIEMNSSISSLCVHIYHAVDWFLHVLFSRTEIAFGDRRSLPFICSKESITVN